MLRRRVMVPVMVALMGWPSTGVVLAEMHPAPVVVSGDTKNGVVSTNVTAPGTAPPAVLSGGSRHDNKGVTCTWTEEPPYVQPVWDWPGQVEPGGRWYDLHCSDGSLYIGVYVPPAASNVPPEIALAGSLARNAVNRLQLPEPRVGHSPAGRALVGLATWFWVDPGQWRPLQQRTSAGPVWAEVTARPVSTSWDAGDGAPTFTCPGPGTPYDRSRPEREQATDCSYTYPRSSAEQPQTGPDVNDRFFTVTVTTSWQVTWSGSAGSGGTLPVLTRSSSFPLAVAQRQTVVTGGSG